LLRRGLEVKSNGLVFFGVFVYLAVMPLGAGCSERPERAAKVYSDWPFDAKEARRRQEATAKMLGAPVEKIVDLGGFVYLELVLIPAGEFLIGSPDPATEVARKNPFRTNEDQFEDERPRQDVRITKPFYIGKYEVTQEQWERVMGSNPSRSSKGPEHPVDTVSWDDCEAFLRKLNASACAKGTFALPTEAEWEYACRAGTATLFHTGETISWEDANYLADVTYGKGRKGFYWGHTVCVGLYRPNAWGLCDMHGNVYEWCADWYDAGYYKSIPRDDPKGPATGEDRVIRGGAWESPPVRCRSVSRGSFLPSVQPGDVGCRVVLRDFQ